MHAQPQPDTREAPAPIRVLLAEDHQLVRDGTRHLLARYEDLDVVGEAADGDETLALVARLNPDVLLVDIRMPGCNGIEVVRQLPTLSPGTRALVLTAHDDDYYILALMRAGAAGYLLKTIAADGLADAIRRVHAGEPVLDPAVAARVARIWSGRDEEGDELLSERELEVLGLAARGMRNKEIAGTLNISVRTVEGHVNAILGKLGVSSRVEAVLHAVARQWIRIEDGREAAPPPL